YHSHTQFVWIDLRLLLPLGEHRRVGKWQGREERGNALLFGQRGITSLKDISQDTVGGLNAHMSHVDGTSANIVGIQPAGLMPVIGKKLHASSPGMFDDSSAFLFRWCFRPEDSQIDVGKVVGISPSA